MDATSCDKELQQYASKPIFLQEAGHLQTDHVRITGKKQRVCEADECGGGGG